MKCTRIEEWLPAYTDGALSPRRARQVAAHLAGCAACRVVHDRVAAALEAFDATGSAEPRGLDLDAAFARLEDRLGERERPETAWAQPRPSPDTARWRDWRLWLPVGVGGAVAAASLAVVLSGPGTPDPDGAVGAPAGFVAELAVARDLELLEDYELFALMEELGVDEPDDVEALAAVEDLEDLEVVLALDELLAEEDTDEG